MCGDLMGHCQVELWEAVGGSVCTAVEGCRQSCGGGWVEFGGGCGTTELWGPVDNCWWAAQRYEGAEGGCKGGAVYSCLGLWGAVYSCGPGHGWGCGGPWGTAGGGMALSRPSGTPRDFHGGGIRERVGGRGEGPGWVAPPSLPGSSKFLEFMNCPQ